MSYIRDVTDSVVTGEKNNWLWALVGLFLLLCPFVVQSSFLYMGIIVMSYALFALSFNLIYGYMGEVPFGHAGFFGLGAYAAGVTMAQFGLPFPVAVVMAFVVPGVVGLVFSLFASKLSAVYFAIFSLAFGEAIRGLLLTLDWLTLGTLGLTYSVPSYLASTQRYYYFTLVVTALGVIGLRRVVNSPFGVMLRSVRDSEQRIRSFGVNPRLVKIANITLAGAVAGVGGLLFAPAASVLYPDLANWETGAIAIWSTLVGGSGVFAGPILGAVLYEPMRTTAMQFTEYWPIVEGAVLLLIMLFLPEGLSGFVTERLDDYRTERSADTQSAAGRTDTVSED